MDRNQKLGSERIKKEKEHLTKMTGLNSSKEKKSESKTVIFQIDSDETIKNTKSR